MSPEHVDELRAAKHDLERAGVGIQFANLLGVPIEKVVARMPSTWREGIVGASRTALERALDVALWTIDSNPTVASSDRLHRVAVAATGALGGAFGLPALAIELPISTTLMLRSIADIARYEGEDLNAAEARLACVEVFALGGRTSADDAAESAYYLARTALGRAVAEAAEFVAAQKGARAGAPALVRFVTRVAARFQVQVSQKAAAQAAPIVGAAGGALINHIFMTHFQRMGRGHFTVRRLERIYSPEHVRTVYARL